MSVAVRLSGAPPGSGEFAVPSRTTTPGEAWVVYWVAEGTCWCGCPGFARRQACRHVQAVAQAIEVEARQGATPERRAEAEARLREIEAEFAL